LYNFQEDLHYAVMSVLIFLDNLKQDRNYLFITKSLLDPVDATNVIDVVVTKATVGHPNSNRVSQNPVSRPVTQLRQSQPQCVTVRRQHGIARMVDRHALLHTIHDACQRIAQLFQCRFHPPTACGRIDGFWERGLSAWDVTAGGLLVNEAGGTVSDFNGDAGWRDGGSIVASNGKLHDELLEHIRVANSSGIS